MSRKANNLRKRLRILTEQRAGFYAKLYADECRLEAMRCEVQRVTKEAMAALANLERHRALSIQIVPENHSTQGRVMAAQITFYPDAFSREFFFLNKHTFGNATDYARDIGRQTAEKVTAAILNTIERKEPR